MVSRVRTFLKGLQIGSLFDLLDQLGRWWLKEFLALFPLRLSEWLMGQSGKALLLFAERGMVGLQLRTENGQPLGSTRLSHTDYSAAAMDDFLASHRLERKDVAIGIQLPLENFFHRQMVLPVEAARSVTEIVVQDLVRKTPFKLSDIYHDHSTSKHAEPGKIVVSQWVTRQEFVKEVITSLDLDLDGVTFLEAERKLDGMLSSPVIMLHNDAGRRKSSLWTLGLALSLSAALLALTTGGLKFWRQQSILDDLEAQLAIAKPKAQQVRASINKLERKQAVILRIRSKRSDIAGLLDIWEEATRVLPSHSWLTELRLSEAPEAREQRVAMSGFSTAAASLVGLIDSSPLFADASLTGPIALDSVEERERFAMQAKLRKSGPRRETP